VTASGSAAPVSVEALYQRYAQDVLAVALRGAGTRVDAEDVAQTTFLNAHAALLRGARPADERAWLLAIARNVCHHRFRALIRRPREEPFDESRHETADREPETQPAVLKALAALAPAQREALVLQGVHGCTPLEIGARLGLGRGAVDALLFRARAALREELDARARPMDCSEVDGLVRHQLNGGLSEEEQPRLRAHLRDCRPCATGARRLRARRRIASLLAFPWEMVSRLGGASGWSGLGAKTATAVALAVGSAAAGQAVVSDDGAPAAGDAPRATSASPAAKAAPRPTQRSSARGPRPAAAAGGALVERAGASRPVTAVTPHAAPSAPAQEPAQTTAGASPHPPGASPAPAAAPEPVGAAAGTPPVPGVLETVDEVLETATSLVPVVEVPPVEVPDVEVPDVPGVDVTVETPVATVEVTVPPVETPDLSDLLPGVGGR
jgi:RNA polymerase sigma factor (sigma-70 family)